MFPRVFGAATLAVALVPVPTLAAPLTLEQALGLAVQRSLTARGARAAAAGAAEAARAAGQLPDPTLSVGLENVPVTGPDRFRTTTDSMTMKRIGIGQEWVSGSKRALRQAAAQAGAIREEATVDTAIAETRVQAALSYIDAWYAGENLRLTTETEHHLHEEFEAARGRLAAASGSSAEVLALAAARGIAEDESADVQQLRANALVSLERWTGTVPDALERPLLPRATGEQAYVAWHPAVLIAQRDLDLARSEASVAASNREPNWSWQVSYGQRTGFSDMLSLGVSIPLQIAPAQRQDRETAAKVSLAEKAQATLDEATRAATAEFRSLSGDEFRLGQRVNRYREYVLAPAQQRTQAALAGYRSSQGGLMPLFDARHAEVEAQRKLLALQRDLAKVQAQLAFRPVARSAP